MPTEVLAFRIKFTSLVGLSFLHCHADETGCTPSTEWFFRPPNTCELLLADGPRVPKGPCLRYDTAYTYPHPNPHLHAYRAAIRNSFNYSVFKVWLLWLQYGLRMIILAICDALLLLARLKQSVACDSRLPYYHYRITAPQSRSPSIQHKVNEADVQRLWMTINNICKWIDCCCCLFEIIVKKLPIKRRVLISYGKIRKNQLVIYFSSSTKASGDIVELI